MGLFEFIDLLMYLGIKSKLTLNDYFENLIAETKSNSE